MKHDQIHLDFWGALKTLEHWTDLIGALMCMVMCLMLPRKFDLKLLAKAVLYH